MLIVEDLTQKYGDFYALRDVGFALKKGEVKGIIGPNGAGKTTLVNAITGIHPPSAGCITLLGRRIDTLPCDAIARLGVGRTFQNIRLFESLSVLDHLRVAQNPRLSPRQALRPFGCIDSRFDEEAEALLGELGIQCFAGHRAADLSYGDRRRVEIARALAGKPSMLILDEPGAGMNETESQALAKTICSINSKRGVSVLLIEHDMEIIRACCDSVVVLNYGQKIADGSFDEVRRSPEVVRAYLGVEEC